MISTTVFADEMAKKTAPPPPPTPDEPSSETARVATDLMEMMREICFNTRDDRGKRIKITQLVDNLLRPVVLREHREFKRKQAEKRASE